MNNNKSWKVFIGGLVIGGLIGALVGGFTVAIIGGTAFINYAMKQDEIKNTTSVGQVHLTPEWKNN
jgi:hypothetical protein